MTERSALDHRPVGATAAGEGMHISLKNNRKGTKMYTPTSMAEKINFQTSALDQVSVDKIEMSGASAITSGGKISGASAITSGASTCTGCPDGDG